MKTTASVELLLPSVQYGNLKLFFEVALDTVSDQVRINETASRLGIRADGMTAELVADVTEKLAIEQIMKLKKLVDKEITVDTYQIEMFTKAPKA